MLQGRGPVGELFEAAGMHVDEFRNEELVTMSSRSMQSPGTTPSSLNLGNFRTVFDDNFARDTSVDHSLWTDYWGGANQFSFSGGALTLSSYEKPYWNPVAIMQHTLGNSAGEGYGLYQFSGYGNAGQGIGICFIMWRADNKYLDSSTPGKATEIDILESWDRTQTGQSTIHYYDPSAPKHNGQAFHQIHISPAQLHTYAMDWERGSLTFYVDGQEMYQDTTHVPLDAADGGSNEVMGAQLINESALVTTPTVQLHITDMSYSAPTQTMPAGSIYLGTPGTVSEAAPGAGVTITELVAAPSLTGNVYAEVLTSTGAVESDYQAETLGLHHTVSFKINMLKTGDVIRVVSGLTGSVATATSRAITITDPATAPPPTRSLSISAPGTAAEASVGAGVTVTETIEATNLSGSVYVEVLSASGAVETGYRAVALSGSGTASVAVHLAKSGDVVRVADSSASPTVVTTSSAVMITDTAPVATLAVSAPGTLQEASVGAGVSAMETITATHLTGSVYAEVLTASGAVETGYKAVALSAGGTASIALHLAKSGDMIKVANTITSPTVTATSSGVTITDPVVLHPLTGVLPKPLYTGYQTVTGTGGVAGLQLERITQGTYNTPGQAGWVKATVASDGNWSAVLGFTKPGMLAHVYAANGGSKTVVDLVNGTPSAPPSSGTQIKEVASRMQGSVLQDMSASRNSSGATTIELPSETAGNRGSLLNLAGDPSRLAVIPEDPRMLHFS